MTGRWTVHLSAEAEASVRELSRTGTADLARALDELSHRGMAAVDIDQAGPEWSGHLSAGDYLVTVAGRESDARIVVVRVELAERHAAREAVDVLPLRLSTRRTIGSVLQGLDMDLRYTWRALRRTPLFATVVIGTLALAFGGATALLDVVHTVYAAALPFGDGDRLMRIRNANISPAGETRRYNLTPADFEIVRAQSRSFTEVIAMGARSLSLLGSAGEYAERVGAAGVSANWTRTLRLAPMLGRSFSPDEERAGSDAGVALISHSLWQRRFGGDSAVLGRALQYDGGALAIIGVMPAEINYPYDVDVWTPWTFDPAHPISSLNVVGRLRDGVTIETARDDATRVHALREEAGLARSANAFDIATVRADFIRDDARTIQALSAAVLFLLVLACVNVANLLVARFTTRRAELGVRAAFGGRRDQQLRQMLLESAMLFAAGGSAGVLLAVWLRRLLSVTVPDNLRTELGIGVERGTLGMGAGVVALTLAVGLAFGLVVGLVAAWRATKTGPMTLLRQGGRGNVGRGDRRLFDVLVAAQLSLSLALLVGASLLIGRFRDLSTTHPGYELEDVSTFRITLEQDRYRDGETRRRLVTSIEERIAGLPGVAAAGITTVNPLCCGDWGAPIEVEGKPVQPGDPATLVAHSYVTPGYFGAMRMPVVRGTGFERDTRATAPPTVVVDEAFAQMAWPGEEALGKRVRVAREGGGTAWKTVIGVVPVTEHDAEMRASWFLPYHQDPEGPSTEHLHVMVRSVGVQMGTLREVVRQIDPALAVYGTTTMAALQRDRTSQDRLGAIVSGIFAVFGLLLAGFSLYGLLSYSVELRTAEMGVRIALGASRRSIMALILRQAAVRMVAGTALGIALAFAANRILQSAVEGLPWVPWQSLAVLCGVMALVAGVAAAVPALRATRIDPVRCLRA